MNIPEPATEKEYREYANKLRRAAGIERGRPKGRRDEAFIEECEKSVVFCGQRLSELGCSEGKKRSSFGVRPLRWISAAAVVLLVLGTGVVSYGYGRKALSEQVQWNVQRILLEKEAAGLRPKAGGRAVGRKELEVRSFDSEEALRAEFGEELLFPGSFEGVYFVSAEVHGEPGNALIRCEYRVNRAPLIIEIDRYENDYGELLAASAQIDYDTNTFTVHMSDALLIGVGPDAAFAYFTRGNDFYIVVGGQGEDIVEDIARRMISEAE